MKLFPALLASICVLAACATGPKEPKMPDVYVIRHLQKAEGPDPGLTAQGREGAQRLVELLDKRPPRAIYVSTTRRARETAGPAAARWKLVPKEYDPSDTSALVARVLAERGPVLVVGHSNTVPEIVERLGGRRPGPLGEADYGSVWLVRGPGREVVELRIGESLRP